MYSAHLLCLLVLLSSAPAAGRGQPIKLMAVKGSPTAAVGATLIRAAYEQLGVRVIIDEVPAKRARYYADSSADGEVHRVAAARSMYKNLEMVETPFNYLEFRVVARGPDFTVKGWESLRPHKVAIVRGIVAMEKGTRGMDPHRLTSYDQMLRFVAAGRSQYGVVTTLTFEIKKKSLDLQGLRLLNPPISRYPLYHFLNRRHKSLAARLNSLLQDWEKSGELARRRAAAVAALVTRPAPTAGKERDAG